MATIPFVTELAIESRDRLLSLLGVCIALGRAAGALVAQPVYASGGIGRVGIVSSICTLVAAGMILGIAERARI